MPICPLLLAVLAAVVTVHLVISIAPHVLTRADRGGDERRGLVIFVEPIRWLGVRWGVRPAASGLRRAGFEGEFRYWRWHSTWRGCLVLPVIMAPRLLEIEARRLAEFIAARLRERPEQAVYLMGYSSGGFVAVRALELLPEDVQVRAAAVLGGAFSPWRDLSTAGSRVSGEMVISSSLADWLIVGAGTLLFGAADRRHTPSVGMLGVRGRRPPNLTETKWTPRMLRMGHLGGHFSAATERYIARYVAPAMGIGRA